MQPIKAKFAGRCARTGTSCAAGALIEKTGNGKWALAAGATSASTRTETKIRSVANGALRIVDLAKAPLVCGACVENDSSYDKAKSRDFSYRADVQLQREGDAFVCPTCGETKAVVADSHVEFESAILPKLYFHANGELSAKVGPDAWAKIKQFFSYTSYAGLAESYEEQDMFELADKYDGMSGGEWTLKNLRDMSKVEDILGILPENRRAQVAKREEIEAARKAADAEVARIEREEKARLDAIERERKGAEFEAFKAENLAGLVQTYTRIQGVEWGGTVTFDKDTPGTWYATGNSYAFGTLRGETVIRCGYGNATCYYAAQEVVDATLFAAWTDRVTAQSAPVAAAAFLSNWERYGADVMGEGDTSRTIELVGRDVMENLARASFFSYRPDDTLKKVAPNLRALTRTKTDDEAGVAALKELSKGRVEMSQNVYVHREVATDALIVQVCQVRGVDMFYTGSEFEALPVIHPWREITPAAFGTDYKPVGNLLSGERERASFTLLRFPGGELIARYEKTRDREGYDFNLTGISESQLLEAKRVVDDRKNAEKAAKKISYQRKICVKSGIEGAQTLEKISDGASLDSSKTGGTGNGSCTELDAVTLHFAGGAKRAAWRVHYEWWCMGEDGDVDDETELFEDADKARARFREFAAR